MKNKFKINNAMWNEASAVGGLVMLLWFFVYFYMWDVKFGLPSIVENILDVVLGFFLPIAVGIGIYLFVCWLIWEKRQKEQ